MDDSYIRHVAVGANTEARRDVEKETEEINRPSATEGIDDVRLDETNGKTVAQLFKEQFDGSDVLDSYDEWSAPLREQVGAITKGDDTPASDAEVAKAVGIAMNQVDEFDRPELQELNELKKQFETEGVDDSERVDRDEDPAWSAVHDATAPVRKQMERLNDELTEDIEPEADTIGREYRLAKAMKEEADEDVPFDHLVAISREVLGKDDEAEKVNAGAAMREFNDRDDDDDDDREVEPTGAAGAMDYDGKEDEGDTKADEEVEKDGRRVYVSDPSEAPPGVSVFEGPQGALFYEPNVEQPHAEDTVEQPGDGDRGEAVNPPELEPVVDGEDDAFMGDPDETDPRDWFSGDWEGELTPGIIDQLIEAVSATVQPDEVPEPDVAPETMEREDDRTAKAVASEIVKRLILAKTDTDASGVTEKVDDTELSVLGSVELTTKAGESAEANYLFAADGEVYLKSSEMGVFRVSEDSIRAIESAA